MGVSLDKSISLSMRIEANEFPALWAEYVNEGNIEKVVGLYHDSASFLPTYSPELIKDSIELSSYFNRLRGMSGLKIRLQHDEITCAQIGAQSYVISGFYSFDFEEGGEMKQHPSRYTFIIDLSLDRPVLHHHSSVLPAQL